MTTSTNTPRLTYLTSDGSTVNFTFNFDIADQNSIAVYVGTTLKTLTTDYTVSFDSGTSGTGTVTLNSAPAINTRVYLIRDTYNVRSTDFAQGGAFLAATINNELDRITQGIQDVDNIVADKVLRVAEPTVETATLTIPAAATRASKTLGFDASGNVTVLTIGSGTVDSVGLSTTDANITLGGTNPVTGTGTITINLTDPLVKNLTGNVTGNVTATTGTSTFNDVIVNGDLTVEGTTTTINTATLNVEDNIIKLASNQSGAPAVNAGIEVERGSSTDKSLIWDEAVDKWTIGSDTFVAGTVEANVTGNLTGNVTGNADSATYSSAVSLTADNTTNATNYLLFANTATGNVSPRTDTGLTYNPGTNTLTGGTFSGVFSGTLTGANDFITVVGDDSTGVNVTLGETIKIAGGSNITTAVTGDTLTINGSNPAQGIIFVGDDSTGTQIGDGETVKIAGGNNITTAMSGDTLTITGSKTIDVNEINSGDSSAIQINDAVNISGATTINNTLAVTGDITTADSLQFDTAAGEATATGKLYYSSDYGTLAHGLGDGTEIIDGIDLVAYVTNAEATTLVKGEVVYIFGASGDRPSVKRADNSGDPTSSKTLGIVKNNITAGSAGYVKTQGIVTGLNTSTFTAGDILWLGTGGAFTATKPLHPAHLVFVGVVLRANAGNGLVYVKPQNGYELDELHDVDVSTAVANDILKYDGSAWFNVPGGELIYNGNSITAASNADIDLTAGGTGNINLNADTIRLGDSGSDATLTTNGTGDIIINTNSGTNSGSITVADGANGNIKILVNGTGKIDLVQELNATNFPFTPSVDNTNLAAYDSPTYVGSRTLYSNLAQGNITDPTERVRANTRFVAIKHPNDSTTYSDADYVIQNTDITVVDINGQSFAQTSRGASARGEANNVFMLNTAGGTKTGPNMNGGSSFVEISEGHGGDLTCSNAMGFRSFISNRADTGEFTRMTNAYGFLSEGIGTGGTGANGTNRFVTNEYGFFSQGATGTSLVTNYYGFYVNSGANATNRFGVYVNNSAYSNLLGGLTLVNNAISSAGGGTITIPSAANSAITIAPNGTGTVRLDTDFVRIGDSNVAATLSTNGTGDLTLSTNNGTNSGTITITQGVNGNITLAPNGTGDVILSADTVQVGDSAAAATITSNGAGNLILQTGSSPTGNITITQGANANISITPDGTGDVILSADTVQVGDSAAAATITTNGAGNLILQTGAASTGNITITQGANQNISITPHGTGAVVIDGSSWPTADGPSGYVLTTNGAGSLSWALAGTGDLVITGTTISAGTTDADITITSNGTGNVNLDVDTVRIGDSNTDANITTNGTGDLILSTNSTTNSGSIRIYDGTGGNIEINPYVDLQLITNKVIVGESNASPIITTNGTGNLSLTANGNAATSAYAYITVDNDGDVNINAAQVSEANRSVYVTLGDSRSTSSDVGKLFVNTITNSPEIETNIIRSNDSSAIQIDDAVNVSGAVTLHGTTRFNSCYTEKINSLTSSTTITVNANLAPVHKVTLGTNTGFVITNLPTGGSLSLIIVQDGTGSRTATFGTDTSTAVKFPGGVATLSTAANAIDIVNIFNDGTNYYGLISKTFS
jgi:hypothetical protein